MSSHFMWRHKHLLCEYLQQSYGVHMLLLVFIFTRKIIASVVTESMTWVFTLYTIYLATVLNASYSICKTFIIEKYADFVSKLSGFLTLNCHKGFCWSTPDLVVCRVSPNTCHKIQPTQTLSEKLINFYPLHARYRILQFFMQPLKCGSILTHLLVLRITFFYAGERQLLLSYMYINVSILFTSYYRNEQRTYVLGRQ